MSESSPQTNPLVLDWKKSSFEFFTAEHTEKDGDIVYHFWPLEGETVFCNGFALALEDGFKAVMPSDAAVEAEYYDKTEAAIFLKAGEANEDAIPRETYYVRVIGWADNPMADKFLRQKVFEEIDKAAKERLNDRQQEG
jgi:hypothetical protein